MNEETINLIPNALFGKSSGRKKIIPLEFQLLVSKPKKELPEYTDEWIGAYLKFLDQNIAFCVRHKDRFPEDDQLLWNSIINAYRYHFYYHLYS